MYIYKIRSGEDMELYNLVDIDAMIFKDAKKYVGLSRSDLTALIILSKYEFLPKHEIAKMGTIDFGLLVKRVKKLVETGHIIREKKTKEVLYRLSDEGRLIIKKYEALLFNYIKYRVKNVG